MPQNKEGGKKNGKFLHRLWICGWRASRIIKPVGTVMQKYAEILCHIADGERGKRWASSTRGIYTYIIHTLCCAVQDLHTSEAHGFPVGGKLHGF